MRRAVLMCLLLSGVSLSVPAPEGVTLTPERPPSAGVRATLSNLPRRVQAALLVRDVQNGAVLESLAADQPFIPASALKTLTGAAVLASRQGAKGWWSTELTVPAAQAGQSTVTSLTVRGMGDPTLSVSGGLNSLRELARQTYASGVRQAGELRLDESPLAGDTFKKTTYGLPMPAARLREWQNHPPQTAAEARQRFGAALLAQLRQAGVKVMSQTVHPAPVTLPYRAPALKDKGGKVLPPDPVIPLPHRPEQGVASVRSGPITNFVNSTLRPSDNGQAEELFATLAAAPYSKGTLADAQQREQQLLTDLGVATSGLKISDGSGLGGGNRVTARTLSDLLKVMYDLPYSTGPNELPDQLYAAHHNAFVEALPLAGTAENLPFHGGRGGTMALRLVGTGLDVRAKTGTLPGVSSLAGYVRGKSGRLLTFVILMNGPQTTPLLTLRALQDRIVQQIAAAH